MIDEKPQFPNWMRGFLILSGIYNLAWGLFIYNFQDSFYRWITKSSGTTSYLISYQGIGVIAFGLLYLITATYPVRLRFLIVIGIISKLVGALGFFVLVMNFQFTKPFVFHLMMNDLIWVVPLSIIALKAFQSRNSVNS